MLKIKIKQAVQPKKRKFVRARAASPPDLVSSAEEDSGISFDMAISEDEDDITVDSSPVQCYAPMGSTAVGGQVCPFTMRLLSS